MAEFSHLSRSELAERRRKLRWKRRWRALRSFWRSLVALTLAVGAIWVVTLPGWVIHRPEQVEIQGNEVLPAEAVRKLLPLDYPEALWEIQPQEISQALVERGAIASASVERRLFPPGITVTIQERRPVAIAYNITYNDPANPAPPSSGFDMELLDATGAIIPVKNYTAMNPTSALPPLKVIGFRAADRRQWTLLYQELKDSGVPVSEIDWRDPGNIILTASLGPVYVGSYSPRFAEQLSYLKTMLQNEQVQAVGAIAYIDLRNLASTKIIPSTATAAPSETATDSPSPRP